MDFFPLHSDKGISCPQFEDNYENGSEDIPSFDKEETARIICKVRSILEDGYKEYIRDLGHY